MTCSTAAAKGRDRRGGDAAALADVLMVLSAAIMVRHRISLTMSFMEVMSQTAAAAPRRGLWSIPGRLAPQTVMDRMGLTRLRRSELWYSIGGP